MDLPLGSQKYTPPRLEGAPHILICEDDSQVGRAMLRILQRSGAEVDLVGTIKSAFAHLAEKRYQVLIIDLLLPDGSGSELVPDITNKEGHPLPVVTFSAREAQGDAVKGVYKALTKSRSSIENLADAVKKMVEEAHEWDSQ